MSLTSYEHLSPAAAQLCLISQAWIWFTSLPFTSSHVMPNNLWGPQGLQCQSTQNKTNWGPNWQLQQKFDKHYHLTLHCAVRSAHEMMAEAPKMKIKLKNLRSMLRALSEDLSHAQMSPGCLFAPLQGLKRASLGQEGLWKTRHVHGFPWSETSRYGKTVHALYSCKSELNADIINFVLWISK